MTADALNFDDIDAVLFDAGGVFVVPDASVIAPALMPYGASPRRADYRRAHYAGMKAKSDDGHLEQRWESYQTAYVEALGVGPERYDQAVSVLANVMSSPHVWRQPITESALSLRYLADAGVPMGVVSNAAGQVQAELEDLEICQVGPGNGVSMRVVVDSHVVGVAKPNPAIFEHALDYFREFERTRILYVGDSVTMDIAGATAAGLRAVLIDPYDDHVGERFPRIRSLIDLCIGLC